ncbi:hypothetical protein L2E82_37850 [Cichorium intybus]|uniref:Uncharacterized protein n=1 Tax=Cichorium intybus TaxID=13427 RepID=A0ACB9AJG2_CICIN|nr:hypothetical protein L2E82_37850 [Cichorium intybus]
MNWKRGPVIGRGSYATVSVATTSTGDLYAVKSTELSTSEFLQKEQHILSQLSSKYIIKYMAFDVDYDDNKPMYNLFMEYASGGTISDFIKKQGGSLDESMIRSYTHQILLGLDHLHCNNFVHCDIKCQNLLVCQDGIKIGDLGCAKVVGNNGATTSQVSGTPVFMAPEVARGEEQGLPADVWALGCSVIEMATGSNPWPEMNDPVSALYRIGYSGDIPEFPKWLTEDGKDFLAKCLKTNAKERWTVKKLLQHPFVCNSNSGPETRRSPTSTLDQSFWESLSVPEPSPEPTQMDNFSGESPAERIRQLVEATLLCLPNWDDEEDWITIRPNQLDEMHVDDDDFGRINSISISNLNVEEEQLENSVSVEDLGVLDYSVVSRVVDFNHIINDIFLNMKESIIFAFRSLCCLNNGLSYEKIRYSYNQFVKNSNHALMYYMIISQAPFDV